MPFYGFIVIFKNLGLRVLFWPYGKRDGPKIGSDGVQMSSMMPSRISEAIQAVRIGPALHNNENFGFFKILTNFPIV